MAQHEFRPFCGTKPLESLAGREGSSDAATEMLLRTASRKVPYAHGTKLALASFGLS